MKPKTGLGYEECKSRIKRIAANPGHPEAKSNLINSIKNQCRIAEGERSLKELETEVSVNQTSSRPYSGSGHKSCGFGPGRKLGEGRWQFIDGKWVLRSL